MTQNSYPRLPPATRWPLCLPWCSSRPVSPRRARRRGRVDAQVLASGGAEFDVLTVQTARPQAQVSGSRCALG